jgi:DNA-directed RNA polymerase subunit M/transcription elongation factor TFIIS
MRFCPNCEYYLYHATNGENLILQCKNCGYNEDMQPKSANDALVLETNFQNTGSSAGLGASGVTVNEYTLADPTLPHTKSLKCPNGTCPSAADAEKRDVIYIKTNAGALKFQYICTVCQTQWRT